MVRGVILTIGLLASSAAATSYEPLQDDRSAFHSGGWECQDRTLTPEEPFGEFGLYGPDGLTFLSSLWPDRQYVTGDHAVLYQPFVPECPWEHADVRHDITFSISESQQVDLSTYYEASSYYGREFSLLELTVALYHDGDLVFGYEGLDPQSSPGFAEAFEYTSTLAPGAYRYLVEITTLTDRIDLLEPRGEDWTEYHEYVLYSATLRFFPVPEPGTAPLIGVGLIGIALGRRSPGARAAGRRTVG